MYIKYFVIGELYMKRNQIRFKPVMTGVLISMAVLAGSGASAGTITGWNNTLGESWMGPVPRDGTNIYGDDNHTDALATMIGDHQVNADGPGAVLIGNYTRAFTLDGWDYVPGPSIGPVVIGDFAQAGMSGVAIGGNARASQGAIAIGEQTKAGKGAIAVGVLTSSAERATAMGFYSTASGESSVAIGFTAVASGTDSVAIGNGSSDGGQENVFSVGSESDRRRIINVADGIDGNDAVNMNQLNAVGQLVAQNTADILALQGGNGLVRSAMLQSTVRAAAPVVSAAVSDSLFAASGDAGETATASGTHATAMGANANASADNSVALGANSVADRANTVSVGAAGSERQITNVAAGTQGTDAVNVNQLNDKITQANAYTDQAVAGEKAYTDQAIASTRRDMERYADRAAASALAIPSIPVLNPGEKWAGVAVGNYGSATAVGVAAAYQVTMNLNLGVGVSSANGGSTALKAQAGYRW
ncbi:MULTISPECIES: YadA family autotransporter adhesin [Caballeronia]|uniref:YadA-like family protein n=1 Tax=Caballeronia jiangsuensis TaxID=1458357 RepID=A0ABW9CHU9_9BURK|nr:YadA-like family protein [Caballeronia sp. GaOx3]